MTASIRLALISSFLFALSPWSIHFSHSVNESTVALVFMLWGLVFWFKKEKNLITVILSSLLFALSLYTYHNVRFFLPLFLLLTLLIEGKDNFKRNLKKLLLFIVFLGVLLIPLLVNLQQGDLLLRVKKVSIFHSENSMENLMEGIFRYSYLGIPFKRVFNNKLVFFGYTFIKKYLEHFSLDFLFLGKEISPRLGVENIGKLYLIELPFLIYGSIKLLSERKKRWPLVLFSWLLLAPVAPSLTLDSPHSLRSLVILPSFQIITGYGFLQALQAIKEKRGVLGVKVFSFLVLILLLFNVGYFFHFYYFYYPEHSGPLWQDGYKQLVDYVWPIKDNYEKVIVTNSLGQPHIFFAFWGLKDPADYQKQRIQQSDFSSFNVSMGKLDNLIFREIDTKNDVCQKNSLLVLEPQKFGFKDNLKPTKTIYYTNRFGKQEPVFYIIDSQSFTSSAAFLATESCSNIDKTDGF